MEAKWAQQALAFVLKLWHAMCHWVSPGGGLSVMIKSELMARIAAANPHLYQRDVERIVATIFEEIAKALSNGDRVELRGFGAFSVKERPARTGRNPRTGEAVFVEKKYVPFFKTGKEMRERLNKPGQSSDS